jgi:RNA polymerase-binding transcription factor DksA
MDDIDFAQYLEECERDEALRRLRQASEEDEERQVVDDRSGVVLCRDCDGPIPKARLAVQRHAVRCIDCQREYDREQALESRLYADGSMVY